MTKAELLIYYRRVLNHIWEGGSIWETRYAGRTEAYNIVALIASNLRREQ